MNHGYLQDPVIMLTSCAGYDYIRCECVRGYSRKKLFEQFTAHEPVGAVYIKNSFAVKESHNSSCSKSGKFAAHGTFSPDSSTYKKIKSLPPFPKLFEELSGDFIVRVKLKYPLTITVLPIPQKYCRTVAGIWFIMYDDAGIPGIILIEYLQSMIC